MVTARLALASAGAAAVLLALSLLHGVSQGQFEVVRPAAEMAEMLVRNALAMRVELFVDFLFLVLYGACFALLPGALGGPADPRGSVPARLGAAALLLTAFLDAAENAHLLSALATAEQGMSLSQGAIQWQAIASQVKFVASYFGLLLIAFALDPADRVERWLALTLRWVQAPVGVAIFVVGPPFLRPLYLARAVFFVVGLLWLAAALQRRARRDGSG
jgi:hypothetical protein